MKVDAATSAANGVARARRRRSLRTVVLASLGAAALVVSLTACTAPLPGNGNCTLSVDYPHGSTTVPGSIDGKGKVLCIFTTGKLTNLMIETVLQKWSGKSWVNVANTNRTTSVATLKSGVQYTGVSGFIPCQNGVFRTQSRSSGYLNGKYSGLSNWYTTNTTKGIKNPCTNPLQVVNVP